MDFNPSPSYIMHIDLNSCFASIEQQANPFLRGRPIAVAAYNSPGGCILAPSIEAKRFGIKTGMRVRQGKQLCSDLLVLTPDPNKYRHVHLGLRKILSEYTNDFSPKSIDEFVLDLKGYPALVASNMQQVAKEIKRRIKTEVGDWLTVSIGISTNRALAKVASGLRKPDGLDEINKANFLEIYKNLKLTDLYGINVRNQMRLNSVGIFSVTDFYQAELGKLKAALKSINSYYWFMRLRGYEIDSTDFARRSFGNSYVLAKPFSSVCDLSPILMKLTEKATTRLRFAGYKAQGVHLGVRYRDRAFWHKGEKTKKALFDTRDIYKQVFKLLAKSPRKPVAELYVTCFNLVSSASSQLELFENVDKKESLVSAVDDINNRWGDFVVTFGKSLSLENQIHDRIAFGRVRDL